MVVLLWADIRLVHILDRDGVLSDELGGTAVSVILFRTATVVGQVCKAFRQLHPQAYTRYHRGLVSSAMNRLSTLMTPLAYIL